MRNRIENGSCCFLSQNRIIISLEISQEIELSRADTVQTKKIFDS
jgi:hypothetical protein